MAGNSEGFRAWMLLVYRWAQSNVPKAGKWQPTTSAFASRDSKGLCSDCLLVGPSFSNALPKEFCYGNLTKSSPALENTTNLFQNTSITLLMTNNYPKSPKPRRLQPKKNQKPRKIKKYPYQVALECQKV